MISSQPSTSYKVAPKLHICKLQPTSIPPKPTMNVCVQTDFYPTTVLKPPEIQIASNSVYDDFGTDAYHKREAERQENVRKTLEMVDKALSFYH